MMFEFRFTKEAKKNIEKLSPKLRIKLKKILINTLAKDPYQGKKLVADLTGFYSFPLTLKDRIIYAIDDKNKILYVHRARTHYGD